MAGMLPGVECARRRRFHQGGGWMKPPQSIVGNGRTRHSTFCLYTSNHDTYLSSSSFMPGKVSTLMHSFRDVELEEAAREAKERLDERLRNQWNKLQYQREGSKWCVRPVLQVLQRLVIGLKKKNKKSKWDEQPIWEQEDVAECLEALQGCDQGLPCGQRLHSWCLVPWLQSTAHFSFNRN